MKRKTIVRRVRPWYGQIVRFEVIHVSPLHPRWWLEWVRRRVMFAWWDLCRWCDRLNRL